MRRDLCRVWPQLADPEPVAPDESRKRQQVIVVLKDMQARGQSINIGEKPLLAKVGTYLGFWVSPSTLKRAKAELGQENNSEDGHSQS